MFTRRGFMSMLGALPFLKPSAEEKDESADRLWFIHRIGKEPGFWSDTTHELFDMILKCRRKDERGNIPVAMGDSWGSPCGRVTNVYSETVRGTELKSHYVYVAGYVEEGNDVLLRGDIAIAPSRGRDDDGEEVIRCLQAVPNHGSDRGLVAVFSNKLEFERSRAIYGSQLSKLADDRKSQCINIQEEIKRIAEEQRLFAAESRITRAASIEQCRKHGAV